MISKAFRNLWLLGWLALINISNYSCDAFLVPNPCRQQPVESNLINNGQSHPSLSYEKNTNFLILRATADENDAFFHNLKRTCIKQFMSQRAFQTFMFLLTDFRDPHTADWLERFLNAPSLIDFHGTGALNMTRFEKWDSYFMELMLMSKEEIIVTARKSHASGRRLFNSGSKNNPFLQQQEHLVEISIDIDPPSLVPRIMSVREQIGREIVADLDLILIHNEQILPSYHKRLEDEVEYGTKKEGQFDREAMQLLANTIYVYDIENQPVMSHTRKSTFDLLQVLSLHESIHRVLRKYKESGQRNELEYKYLRDFFSSRVRKYFDGPGPYDRADDFIEELLGAVAVSNPVSLNQSVLGEVCVLQIVGDILNMRTEVCKEWKYIVDKTNYDHIDLRKGLLTKSWQEANDENILEGNFEDPELETWQ